MYYIIYKTTNILNDKIYIGMHETDNLDDNYLGSGTALKRALNKYGENYFKREILFQFTNREEMVAKEVELVNEDFISRKDTYNITGGGHGSWKHSKGKLTVIDENGNTFQVDKNDPRLKTGEVHHNLKGKICVVNKDGIKLSIDKGDPRLKTGELVHTTKIRSIKKDGTIIKVYKNDKRFDTGEIRVLTNSEIKALLNSRKQNRRFIDKASDEVINAKDFEGKLHSVKRNDKLIFSGELVFYSVQYPNKPKNAIDREELKELRKTMKIKELAYHYNVSIRTINRLLK